MEDYEPITKELRKAAKAGYVVVTESVNAFMPRDVFDHLCDNIDAVHKRLEDLCNRTKDEWMRLPVDADGVPIYVGDVLDGYAKTITVASMRYESFGWVLISDEGGGFHDCEAFTHHNTPTVEDVLREFALSVCEDEALTIRKGVVEEYAAKLREVMANDRD